jgi:uncharacterized coiled-coil DUF342 family protein
MSKDSIKVAVRIRPMNKNELSENSTNVISVNNNSVTVTDPVSKKTKDFGFDYVFGEDSNNSNVCASLGSNIIESALSGYNCCVLAYGQTGSGKTYTMLNYNSANTDIGLIPYIANSLISLSTPTCEIRMEASFIEIYAEKIFDLLSTDRSNLKLHIDSKVGTYVENLTSVAVTNTNEIMKLIERGFAHRSTSPTAMNEQSSRSHAIFTITFKQITYDENKKPLNTKISKINLVDLAGSERVKTSKVTGTGFQEAVSINKSLSMLSTVFNDLIESGVCNKFRSSVLTALLADSISGRSKTIIIANVSPASIQYEISVQTLFYVYRTKKIKIVAKINEIKGSADNADLKQEIDRLKAELESAKKSKSIDQINKLKLELAEYEKLYQASTVSWSDKLEESYKLISALEAESKSYENNLKQHLSDKEILQQELQDLNQKLAESSSEIQELNQRLTESSSEIQELNQTKIELNQKLTESSSEIQELNQKLAESSSEIQELNQKLSKTEIELKHKLTEVLEKNKLVENRLCAKITKLRSAINYAADLQPTQPS